MDHAISIMRNSDGASGTAIQWEIGHCPPGMYPIAVHHFIGADPTKVMNEGDWAVRMNGETVVRTYERNFFLKMFRTD